MNDFEWDDGSGETFSAKERLSHSSDAIDDDWYFDYDDDEADDFNEYESSDDPCDHCGPTCEFWGGDGICDLVLQQQAEESADYEAEHVTVNVICPVCGQILTMYDVQTGELWTWPGDWYNPMIALNIYAVYDAPKGELHRADNICHIWVGNGEYRREKLIRLLERTNDQHEA
jgi:hypothetical protein